MWKRIVSELNHHIEHISAEQMEYYLGGVLGRREMHTIERHLLDCEFCKEAMDGYESSQIDIGGDIKDLRGQLSNRVGVKETILQPEARFVTYHNYGIAAIITLLLVSIYHVFDLQQDTITEVAQNEESVPKMDAQAVDTTLVASNEVNEEAKGETSLPIKDIAQPTEIISSENPTGASIIASRFNQSEGIEESLASEEPEIAALKATGAKLSSGAGGATSTANEIPLEADDQTFAKEKKDAFVAEAFDEGIDLEEVDQPTIVLSKPSEESVAESAVENIQFEALRKRARSNSQQSLERSTKSVISPIGRKAAEPEIGLEKYFEAIQLETNYPDEAFRQGVQGNVEVSFSVEATGQLSNVRITKSLGSGCDEEAMRLVTEGPAWLPAESDGEPVSTETQIIITFKLDN